ncbi:MAG: hypothetical protein AB7E67_06480 [Xanthobacteraceae bacterium]
MYLTVKSYDELEHRATGSLPNRIIECCVPVAFLQESYPIRITSERSAYRYVDVMQDGRSEDTFKLLIGGITLDEMEAMRSIARKVGDATERLYGRRLVPRSALLRSLNVVRHVRYLLPAGDTLIFEVGAGSGYVGALLLEFGYRYACMDITQAFYIWQSHLLQSISADSFVELAVDDMDLQEALDSRRAIHIPWWRFVVLNPDLRVRINGATCNHALCEMHPNALAHFLFRLHSMLEGRPDGSLIFEGWGSTIRRQIWHVGQAISSAQFVFAHNDVKSSVVVRSDSPAALFGMKLPHVVGKHATDEAKYHPNIHVNDKNSISRILNAGRAATAQGIRFGLSEFDEMLREVLGGSDLMTDDERFMALVHDHR